MISSGLGRLPDRIVAATIAALPSGVVGPSGRPWISARASRDQVPAQIGPRYATRGGAGRRRSFAGARRGASAACRGTHSSARRANSEHTHPDLAHESARMGSTGPAPATTTGAAVSIVSRTGSTATGGAASQSTRTSKQEVRTATCVQFEASRPGHKGFDREERSTRRSDPVRLAQALSMRTVRCGTRRGGVSARASESRPGL